ncbi:MAG: hypothetical protein V3V08_20825 [Nannocystaceae bacterium]
MRLLAPAPFAAASLTLVLAMVCGSCRAPKPAPDRTARGAPSALAVPEPSDEESAPYRPVPPPGWETPSDTPSEQELGRGSGSTDETNGTCRLYAPRLPNPQCCPREYGFDAVVAAQLCGHEVFLGESMHFTCGYHFGNVDGTNRVWFRTSSVAGPEVAKAAADHDLVIRKKLRIPDFKSVPIPGVPGAFWSRNDGFNWAFLPGWSFPRRVSWHDTSCSRENMPKLLKAIADATQPEDNRRRRRLLPTAQ